MIVSSSGSDYKPVPAGSYIATSVRVIDLGTQTSNYQGQEKAQRKVLITWEIPEVEIELEDGNMPALISSSYTASLHEKASLRKVLESWRGRSFTADELKGFDLKNVLGKPCMINVVHTEKDGNTYANVAAVMPLPKGVKGAPASHELINVDLDDFEEDAFERLSDRLQDKIRVSPEYKAIYATDDDFRGGDEGGISGRQDDRPDLDDEIPF